MASVVKNELKSVREKGFGAFLRELKDGGYLRCLPDGNLLLLLLSSQAVDASEYANNKFKYSFTTNSTPVRGTIDRYKKACAASTNAESVSEANTQFYQQEASKFKRQIRDIQNLNRHILGEALSSLSLKELKNLESRLEKGLSRVRSRKHETLFADIEFMQKRPFSWWVVQ
ncbi:agamous-like MADS-box protein AGL5 isoform X1 [Glycine soja]|uniref:agamous-like MADS-box protein MADS1 n=1 Tax=Glycine max TaxID=3847 RepID=UPI00103E11B9|nr:agamous-like MADS-box protein MADS1 [Glycine max]XP_028198425.1 agamous-like MADS-box protein AGL5 isoform X1 [Glycine soja]XP_028198426.1 agamous-like MADS-box protein AGL5 isoform X1 [Glycine soja]XP_028198427.1 agamous-like MADS-box protein AGL5 isoform X1 [Glycine soja]XP_028198428.1 agamous-like MADS-box protein AGL5 isoform X1 [Glycine soja]XP_028198429.1 agamous-like MADS-box protein AGL5 isoform X1 [Glycine soja]XP_028198430.1 agamous-like MADS-box protein AGL5 isoform X1 [Glycine 